MHTIVRATWWQLVPAPDRAPEVLNWISGNKWKDGILLREQDYIKKMMTVKVITCKIEFL